MIAAFIVAIVSLIGAALPLRLTLTHARLQIYLSLAAGALLGAAFFHLLPESTELIPHSFGIPVVVGVLLVFLLQRYVAPHSHESIDPLSADHEHGHHHEDCADHHEEHGTGPFLSSTIAVLALSVHSFFDGVALGAALFTDGITQQALALSVFLSVLIHKPMDGLSVTVLLLKARVSRAKLWLVQIFYAALVPLGMLIFWLVMETMSATVESTYIGYVLALSAGIFCSIALTDLLPELHFHKHDRNKLTLALLVGLGVMFITSFIEHSSGAHDGAHERHVLDEHQSLDHDHP